MTEVSEAAKGQILEDIEWLLGFMHEKYDLDFEETKKTIRELLDVAF